METFVATGDVAAANLAEATKNLNPLTHQATDANKKEINKAILTAQVADPLATYAITKNKNLMASVHHYLGTWKFEVKNA